MPSLFQTVSVSEQENYNDSTVEYTAKTNKQSNAVVFFTVSKSQTAGS